MQPHYKLRIKNKILSLTKICYFTEISVYRIIKFLVNFISKHWLMFYMKIYKTKSKIMKSWSLLSVPFSKILKQRDRKIKIEGNASNKSLMLKKNGFVIFLTEARYQVDKLFTKKYLFF